MNTLFAFAVLQFLDVVTTLVGLKVGYSEANPSLRLALAISPTPLLGLVITKAIVSVPIVGWHVRTQKPWVVRKINYWFAALVLWNLCWILLALFSRQ